MVLVTNLLQLALAAAACAGWQWPRVLEFVFEEVDMKLFNKSGILFPTVAFLCATFFFLYRAESIATAVQMKHKTNSALLVPNCIRETKSDGIPHFEVFAFHYPHAAFLLRADKHSNALINEATKRGCWTNNGKEKWTTKHDYSMFEVRWHSNQSPLFDSSLFVWDWECLPEKLDRIMVEPCEN